MSLPAAFVALLPCRCPAAPVAMAEGLRVRAAAKLMNGAPPGSAVS